MSFEEVPIGAAFDVRNGATPASGEPRYWDGDIPWVGPADLGKLRNRFIEKGERSITPEGYASCGTRMVPEGAIILSIRAPIGHMAIASNSMCFNQGCRGLVPRAIVRPGYAYWALLARRPFLEAAGQGTTFVELARDKLRAERIPLPDRETQKVIADFLDGETARIDLLIKKKHQLVERLEVRLRAALRTAILGGATVSRSAERDWLKGTPEGWSLIPLKHLVTTLGGATPSKEREDYWIGDIPWISPKDMKVDVLYYVPDHVSESAIEDSALAIVPAESVLIVVRGMILARTVPICRLGRDGTINQDMKALLPNTHLLSSKYLQRMLQGFENVLMSFVEEAAHGTKKLRSDHLFNMKFPIPPREIQINILREYEAQREISERLKEGTLVSIDRLNEFRAALITAAVTGQIDVATWHKRGQTDRRLDEIEEAMTS